MKTAIFTLLLMFLIAPGVDAQSKIKQRDLRGAWKLVVDIDKEQGDNAIERAALGAVDGLLSGVDVTFQFEKNNELKMTIYVFGEEEVEYTNWEFTDDGGVYIGDNEHVEIEDTVWYLEGEKLIARNENKEHRDYDEPEVYLKKVY